MLDIISSANESESKAASSWIIGEYAENIPKSIELMS